MCVRTLLQSAIIVTCGIFASHASLAATPPGHTGPGALRSDHLRHFVNQLNRSANQGLEPVTVILETDHLDTQSSQMISGDGGKVRYHQGRQHQISIPASRLSALLDKLPQNVYARLPFPHAAVSVTSQGVALTGAEDMQALSEGGTGVKVGIIDLGFGSYTSAQSSGDLPVSMSVTDYTGTGTGGTSHGTQVAEIVHDMAPDAQLYLAKVSTTLEMQQAVNDMIAAGVKVINHSVAWFGAAFYDGSGTLCDITSTADSGGIQWVNAMGNSRYQHYLGTFTDSDSDLRHEFASGQNYNTVSINSGNSVTLILNWDAYPTTNIDYNLYLYSGNPDSGGTLVASSANRQIGTSSSYPYESLSYTATASGTYYIVVTKNRSSTANIPLTLFSIGSNLGTNTFASSLTQPADCATVLSVAATKLTDVAEYFSSEGPTTDGRPKPDVSGPDRVVTSLSSSFAGTSAASPHVAGAVADLLSQDPTLTPVQIRNAMKSSVIDVGASGYDYRTGYGRISLDADQDSVVHDLDNCPLVANLSQVDTDGDSQGNACDPDDDNDGLSDVEEIAIGTNTLVIDTDGDGLSDYAEVNYDGNPLSYLPGVDLNPLSVDTDGDGLLDSQDPLPLDFNYADGDVAPLGAPDGKVDVADYIVIQQILHGTISPSSLELAHGDLYPSGAPDGIIDMSDLILLQRLVLP